MISNAYTFSPTWLGNLVLAASLLHLTQTRNSDLGFALAFPFSSTALTISGFETFGDNQFATPITLFPDLRNQDKYQLRYDLSHVAGSHALKFGVDFIHEPVLSGAFASTAEQFIKYPSNPDCYINPPGADCGGITSASAVLLCSAGLAVQSRARAPLPASPARTLPPATAAFSQNVQRLAFYAEDSWRVSHHLTVNYGLRYQTTFGLFEGSGRTQPENSAYITLQALADSDCAQRAARLPQADRAAPRNRLFPARQREDRVPRGIRLVLRRSRAERMGHRVSGSQQHQRHHRNLRPHRRPRHLRAHRRGLPAGRRRQHRQPHRLQLQNALRHSHYRRSAARLQRALAGQRRLCS